MRSAAARRPSSAPRWEGPRNGPRNRPQSQHARIYDFPIAFLHPLGLDPPHLHRLGDGLHRVRVEPPAAVARAPHHEHRRLFEQPVEGGVLAPPA